uniref:ATP-binding cassette sub-family G member 2 n=1 Tax=Schistocephalus solidus TaxID=70667 RepID=A0A0X3Q5J8_SCHSO
MSGEYTESPPLTRFHVMENPNDKQDKAAVSSGLAPVVNRIHAMLPSPRGGKTRLSGHLLDQAVLLEDSEDDQPHGNSALHLRASRRLRGRGSAVTSKVELRSEDAEVETPSVGFKPSTKATRLNADYTKARNERTKVSPDRMFDRQAPLDLSHSRNKNMNYLLTAPRVRPPLSDHRSALQVPPLLLVNGRTDVNPTAPPGARPAMPTNSLHSSDLDNPMSSPVVPQPVGQSPFPENTRLPALPLFSLAGTIDGAGDDQGRLHRHTITATTASAPQISVLDNYLPDRRQPIAPRTFIPLSAVPQGMLGSITGEASAQARINSLVDPAAGAPGGRAYSLGGLSTVSARTMIPGSVITFQDIKYVVTTKKTACSKPVIKTVLNGVSGIMRPGVNAIMGPTGCGKSSLLDVLAGRKDPKYLSGEVLVDGAPQPKNFKCISGYVVQDDILMGTLTVRESLYFAAVLRRKASCTKAETNSKVDDVLEELGLMHVADTKIGTELFRGVSGGERKRTSIGMEIIADPSVLFLDEPTTGLDAFTAGSVIQTLKTLSRRGRTIILSIHQPKYSIYKLFDSLTLVCGGQIVYHGPGRKDPIHYFARLGYICEDHNNPPDFFLDILHGEVKPVDPNQMPFQQDEYFDDAQTDFELTAEESTHQMNVVTSSLVSEWQDSAEFQRVNNELMSPHRNSDDPNASETVKAHNDHVSYSAPFSRQMRVICWRTFLNLIRDPQASIVQTLVYLFFAVSMGVVYFGLDRSLETGLQNRAGLFFFATLQVVFVNIGAIELFLKERAIFIHEHSSGYYRVSAYFLAKLICDVLPTKALPVFFFMPITYWMAKLVPKAGNFFFFELILTLGTVSAAAAALFVSASVTTFSIANVIISILFVFMMVFGGYLINLNSMGAWLSWLRYFSIFRYTLGGLLINEVAGLEFCPSVNRSTDGFVDTRTCESGTQYLQDMALPSSTLWDLWCNAVGLGSIAIVCLILCYVQLRRISVYK